MSFAIIGVLTWCLTSQPDGAAETAQKPQALRIIVLMGEDAVNVLQQKTAVAPVVEVRDRNNLPVAGATVTFSVGQGATFGGASTLTVVTNAAGQAAATGLTPTVAGTIQIQAAAAFQGQTAIATIAQSNVMTAAQASASAAGGAGGGGGGSSAAIVGGVAGAAGAGVLAAVVLGREPEGPALSIGGDTNVVGIRDVTVFTFNANSGAIAGATPTWNFGDGTTGSGSTVTHTYTGEGTFTVTLSSGDQTTTTTVRAGSLNGTWIEVAQGTGSELGITFTHRLVIVQQGGTLTGTYAMEVVPDNGPFQRTITVPLSGTVVAPRAITISQQGECFRVMSTGTVDAGLTVITGQGTTGNPACEGDRTFRFNRQ